MKCEMNRQAEEGFRQFEAAQDYFKDHPKTLGEETENTAIGAGIGAIPGAGIGGAYGMFMGHPREGSALLKFMAKKGLKGAGIGAILGGLLGSATRKVDEKELRKGGYL